MKSINRRTAIKLTAAGVGALAFRPGVSCAQDAAQPFGTEFPELDSLATGEWWSKAAAATVKGKGRDQSAPPMNVPREGVVAFALYTQHGGVMKMTAQLFPLKTWPYAKGSAVKLFILAGHRNMEGERAFTQELKALPGQEALADDNHKIVFKYNLGGGYKTSKGWEPLGPAGFYDTFGPELSFGKTLQGKVPGNIAIAKFTHSGSQMNDWTPQGTTAKDRNLYPQFIAFIQESIRELNSLLIYSPTRNAVKG